MCFDVGDTKEQHVAVKHHQFAVIVCGTYLGKRGNTARRSRYWFARGTEPRNKSNYNY